jgi:hypothetical protein
MKEARSPKPKLTKSFKLTNMREDLVHVGFWVNHDYGPIKGSTYTTSTRSGAFLVAFFALFVSTTGVHFWSILRFLIHQHRARYTNLTLKQRQEQVILRNSSSILQTAWDLGWITFEWQKVKKVSPWRGSSLTALALLNLVIFSIAGIFSSQISKSASRHFLLKPSGCDQDAGPFIHKTAHKFYDGENSQIAASAKYARRCYEQESEFFNCDLMAIPSIPSTHDMVSCPFDPSICLEQGQSTYRMDTGYSQLHSAMGYNLKPKNRLVFRKVSQCAMLKPPKDVQVRNVSYDHKDFFDKGEQEEAFVNYGAYKKHNYTFAQPTSAWRSELSYTLKAASSVGHGKHLLFPIRELNRTDSNLSIFFLSLNQVMFPSPVNDPLFAAHRPSKHRRDNSTLYMADNPMNFIACTDQFEICDGAKFNSSGKPTVCTPPTMSSMLSTYVPALQLNKEQHEVAKWFANVTERMVSGILVDYRGNDLLRATESVTSGLADSPPADNQRYKEVQFWFDIGLARLQVASTLLAQAPKEALTSFFSPKPPQALCGTALVSRSYDHQNFSVLGMGIVLALGGSIIITSLTLQFRVSAHQQTNKADGEALCQWHTDSILALQQKALGGSGRDPLTSTDGMALEKTIDSKVSKKLNSTERTREVDP